MSSRSVPELSIVRTIVAFPAGSCLAGVSVSREGGECSSNTVLPRRRRNRRAGEDSHRHHGGERWMSTTYENAQGLQLSSVEWLLDHHQAKENERRKMVQDLRLRPGDRVLDSASGPGLWSRLFAERV